MATVPQEQLLAALSDAPQSLEDLSLRSGIDEETASRALAALVSSEKACAAVVDVDSAKLFLYWRMAPFSQEVLDLRRDIAKVQADIDQLPDMKQYDAQVKAHIARLHDYNNFKDMGQALLGRIATLKGETTKAMYPVYGLSLQD